MTGLWKNKVSGWKKDSKRKKQRKYNFIKDKKSLFKRFSSSLLDELSYHELNYLQQKELFTEPNIWRKEKRKTFFYNEIEHPKMCNIVFGEQFSKKPYKKVVYKKSRAIDKKGLYLTLKEYKNSATLIALSLKGTYGMDIFFDIDDSILDFQFSYINKIDLDIS